VGKTEGPSDDELRAQIIQQLRESLARSQEMMINTKLDPKTRERWTQLHTNTAQVLNQVLRDSQAKDWERRLRELEAAGHLPRRISLLGIPKGMNTESRRGEAS
jgi:urease accessory protein UreF